MGGFMSNDISVDELNRIFVKWEGYEIPSGVSEKAEELSTKVAEKILKMMYLDDRLNNIDKHRAFELGQSVGRTNWVQPA